MAEFTSMLIILILFTDKHHSHQGMNTIRKEKLMSHKVFYELIKMHFVDEFSKFNLIYS